MSASTAPLDIIATIVAVSAIVFGNDTLASLLAPNAIIIVGAGVGTYFSTTKADTPTWSALIVHIFCVCAFALLTTVPLALLAAHYTGVNAEWLLAPIAILLGARNKRLPGDIQRLWGWGLSKLPAAKKDAP